MEGGHAEKARSHGLSGGIPAPIHRGKMPRRQKPPLRGGTASESALLRTECHANANFSTALRDGVDQDSVCSNGARRGDARGRSQPARPESGAR